ncbi:hypothetical protein CPC08DRAFT_682210 [Agrocybe pediades]|nr:hypothetical protein CPC08DRAFT_682210 [Agrocybe pediades]
MPPAKSAIWDYFIPGDKQNTAHTRAHCRGCIENERPEDEPIEVNDAGQPILVSSQSWVVKAMKDGVGSVNGVRDSMLAHILGKGGNTPCPNVSKEVIKAAKAIKSGKRPATESQDSNERPKKRALLNKVEQSATIQTLLKVHSGIRVPFKEEQIKAIHQQFLRATVSANLPFRWVDDPEIIALFMMFRSTATDAIPSRLQISGPLLDTEDERVKKDLKKSLKGLYVVLASDGWKDDAKNAITGVNLATGGKTYLIDLILATAHKKDGEAMCKAFGEMIDKAEETYKVTVVAFCCDNDGGSQRGRKDLVLSRPWLFGPPCCAHQFQLILGEYFMESEEAAEVAEQATGLIGWILNHGRVRSIFDEAQAEASGPSGKVLAYLVANLTRWTTHFIAFDRLHDLKDPLRLAVISRKDEIIAAQVGAEKNRAKKDKLEKDATTHCDLIDDGGFWRRLKAVVDDLEPICLGLNLNQTDAMRPDQALLTFAGIFLYFRKHQNKRLGDGMAKRIEKRWKALDQPMFVLALVLNPFEGVTRFGTEAAVHPFTLNTILLETFRRVKSRPPKTPRTEEEEGRYNEELNRKEREVSEAFMSYISSIHEFADWESNKETFQRVHGKNPVAVWQTFLSQPRIRELADFAILLLGMSVNQAGLERDFSDLKIKKTRLRNRLKLPRLEKMSKVGANIRASHKLNGFVEDRNKRQNHESSKVGSLLEVPRYADIIDDDNVDEEGNEEPVLVKTRADWRREMGKWVKGVRDAAADDNEDGGEEMFADTVYGRSRSKWLPRSLGLLFGGRDVVQADGDEQQRRIRRRTAYSEEARLMELLADEEADEERTLDDGALEGSGDEYEG